MNSAITSLRKQTKSLHTACVGNSKVSGKTNQSDKQVQSSSNDSKSGDANQGSPFKQDGNKSSSSSDSKSSDQASSDQSDQHHKLASSGEPTIRSVAIHQASNGKVVFEARVAGKRPNIHILNSLKVHWTHRDHDWLAIDFDGAQNKAKIPDNGPGVDAITHAPHTHYYRMVLVAPSNHAFKQSHHWKGHDLIVTITPVKEAKSPAQRNGRKHHSKQVHHSHHAQHMHKPNNSKYGQAKGKIRRWVVRAIGVKRAILFDRETQTLKSVWKGSKIAGHGLVTGFNVKQGVVDTTKGPIKGKANLGNAS